MAIQRDREWDRQMIGRKRDRQTDGYIDRYTDI
jgi:hypothetical protein